MSGYVVVENKRIDDQELGYAFAENILYKGALTDCCVFEEEKRAEYRRKYGDEFGISIDCHTERAEAYEHRKAYTEMLSEYASTLTSKEKSILVEIDGKKYHRYILEFKEKFKEMLKKGDIISAV